MRAWKILASDDFCDFEKRLLNCSLAKVCNSTCLSLTSTLAYDVFCGLEEWFQNSINSLVRRLSEVDEIWIHNFLAYEVFCEYDVRLWIKWISLPRIWRFLRVEVRLNSHCSALKIRIPCIGGFTGTTTHPSLTTPLVFLVKQKISKYDVLRIFRMHYGIHWEWDVCMENIWIFWKWVIFDLFRTALTLINLPIFWNFWKIIFLHKVFSKLVESTSTYKLSF